MISKNFKLALRAAVFFLILTAVFHSLSFVSKPQPQNDQEKQLIEITSTYQMDLGGGIFRTYSEIFTALSSCFTLICLFGGFLLWFLMKNQIDTAIFKGVLHIYLIIFGSMFVIMACLTFWPPIICCGCITGALIWARLVA
ncbi:MAG: hypothetical protein IPM34_11510 [Saprospiraceae bacterium]|nr:hypothetical protein [Saprospiraceae bacterium]